VLKIYILGPKPKMKLLENEMLVMQIFHPINMNVKACLKCNAENVTILDHITRKGI
jgi:hypothetical protein